MRVVLIANYLPDEQESMQRYAALLAELLARKGCRVEILRPKPHAGRLCPSGRGPAKWVGYLDKFVLFPFLLRRHIHRLVQENAGADSEAFLYHICDHSNAMYTRWLRHVPHVVTCHDLLAVQSALGLIPQHRTSWSGRILQRWIFTGLRRARHLICVSQATQKDLLALAPELAARSTIIDNPLPEAYAPMPPDEARAQLSGLDLGSALAPHPVRFLLHVGGNQWYKNREGVIRIFSHLQSLRSGVDREVPLKLIMAGKPPTPELERLVNELGLNGKIVFTGLITDNQVRALYSLAQALIFPSWREGFGWPLLEAQACGCPVVTSDQPPMSVVAGPAARLADPADHAAFASCILELLAESAELSLKRKIEARQHTAAYAPTFFQQRMMGLYTSILQES